MNERIKEVCAEFGWREVGPDHDIVGWIKGKLSEVASLQGEFEQLVKELEDAQERLDEADLVFRAIREDLGELGR